MPSSVKGRGGPCEARTCTASCQLKSAASRPRSAQIFCACRIGMKASPASGLYGQGRTVIRHCHALPYRDSPHKRELEKETDRSLSSKPAGC